MKKWPEAELPAYQGPERKGRYTRAGIVGIAFADAAILLMTLLPAD